MEKKVLLGMSGGVDSSVAALLLKQQGYEVIGITLELFNEKSQNSVDAKNICDFLGIEHFTYNCENEFKKCVIQDFIECYSNCRTPNPCIECNKYMKFGVMYEKAKELGCDYIATGHYAKIVYNEELGQKVIIKSKSEKKDQTYVLYGIEKEKLNHIIFPLGDFENKEEIRNILKDEKLDIISSKKDSQEICFIRNNDYGEFLDKNIKTIIKKGTVVDKNGNKLGEHKGLIYYTIGQRKGLRNIKHTTIICNRIR